MLNSIRNRKVVQMKLRNRLFRKWNNLVLRRVGLSLQVTGIWINLALAYIKMLPLSRKDKSMCKSLKPKTKRKWYNQCKPLLLNLMIKVKKFSKRRVPTLTWNYTRGLIGLEVRGDCWWRGSRKMPKRNKKKRMLLKVLISNLQSIKIHRIWLTNISMIQWISMREAWSIKRKPKIKCKI